MNALILRWWITYITRNLNRCRFAGSDTTSSTLTYILYELSMAPILQTKLRDAVTLIAKRLNCRPTDIPHDCLTQIEYLDMVIKEGLRKNPAIPASLPREVPENGREIAGYFFPAKVCCFAIFHFLICI